MAISSPVSIPQRTLPRKQSTRRLAYSNDLRSSEMTPSEDSSCYNAVPLTLSTQGHGYSSYSDTAQDNTPMMESVGEVRRREQVSSEPHIGTKLFTIIERTSVPSMKTVPSSWDFQQRVFSLQPKLSSDIAQARHSRMAQRRCYSADDSDVRVRLIESDISTATSAEVASEPQSPERHHTSPPAVPVEPPYRPPERMQTPIGLPRWPGETNHDQAAIQQLTVRTSRRNLLMQYLRRPSSRPKLKEVLRGERSTAFDTSIRTGTRFWRPPTSGHSTRRYDELESHPFSFIPIADVRAAEPASRCQPTSPDEAGPYNGEVSLHPSVDTVGSVRTVQKPSKNPASVIGESLRALRYAGHNAVPVSPRRVLAHVANRSAAVPAHVQPPLAGERTADRISQSLEIDTMRTADLLARCLSPPGDQQRRQRAQAHERNSWSILLSPSRDDDTMPRQSRQPRRHVATNSEESEVSNVAIRGESQARYRHSGTPIYDEDGISLTSFDRERGTLGKDNGLQPDSTMREPLGRMEFQRAISNGALRFSTRVDAPSLGTFNTHTRPFIAQHQNPAIRELVETPQICKHKLAKLHSLAQKYPHLVDRTAYHTTHFDGTSSPIPAPAILAHDHAFAGPSISTQARMSVAPVQDVDRSPTTTTFVTAPNATTTYVTSPTVGPTERSPNLASVQTSSTMPGRA